MQQQDKECIKAWNSNGYNLGLVDAECIHKQQNKHIK